MNVGCAAASAALRRPQRGNSEAAPVPSTVVYASPGWDIETSGVMVVIGNLRQALLSIP